MATARRLPGGCVVTVFVNPTQFDDPADLERYPRTLEDDVRACEAEGASVVFAPSVEDVYPEGPDAAMVDPPAEGIDKGLEDAHRPGHFAGVCSVVARLFAMTRPAFAVFGAKDWQQYAVVSAMVRREAMDIDVIACDTVREVDGLAMSSRNVFLPQGRRDAALSLSRALRDAQGMASPDAAEAIMRATLDAGGVDAIDYAAVRDAETLEPISPALASAGRPMRCLIAARVGSVRLLDNAPWAPALA